MGTSVLSDMVEPLWRGARGGLSEISHVDLP
jgi:hypothetical protein